MSREREQTDEGEDSDGLLRGAPPFHEVRDQLAGYLWVTCKVWYHLVDMSQEGGHQFRICDSLDQWHQLHQVGLHRQRHLAPVFGGARKGHLFDSLLIYLQKCLEEWVGPPQAEGHNGVEG